MGADLSERESILEGLAGDLVTSCGAWLAWVDARTGTRRIRYVPLRQSCLASEAGGTWQLLGLRTGHHLETRHPRPESVYLNADTRYGVC